MNSIKTTKKERQQAKLNGIPLCTVHGRLKRGWSSKEAVTIPPNTHRVLDADLIARAASNGINKNTLYARIYIYEWEEERAVTEPVNAVGKWMNREGIKG